MNRLFAILVPSGLLLVVAVWLSAEPEGTLPLSWEAKALDARIADAGGVDVALLGNSKVFSDLDTRAIAGIFDEPQAVVPLGVNGTGMPVWYAVLAYRVLANEHRPELVVVYGTLAMMVQTRLPTEEQRRVLSLQLPGPDAVINHKVFGEAWSDPRLQRALTRRSELRRDFLGLIRDATVGGIFDPPGEGDWLSRGRARAAPAMADIFEFEALNDEDRVRAVPVVEEEVAEAVTEGQGVEDTLIPDLVELAQGAGAQVVFVRAPLGSKKRATDLVDPELEEATLDYLAAHGVAYVDLRDSGLDDRSFGDGAHMSKAGRANFTPALVAALQGLGVGTGQLVTTRAPRRPEVRWTRSGEAPALPAVNPVRGEGACDFTVSLPTLNPLSDPALAGSGLPAVSPIRLSEDGQLLRAHATVPEIKNRCAGASLHQRSLFRFSPSGGAPEDITGRNYALTHDPDLPAEGPNGLRAWWIYPGTTLEAEVGPTGAGTVHISVREVVAGGGPLTARVIPNDTPSAAGATTLSREGRSWVAALDVPHGAWSLELGSGEGSYVMVERIEVRTGESSWFMVGNKAAAARADLLGLLPEFAAAPPTLAPVGAPLTLAWKPDTIYLDTSALGVPPRDAPGRQLGLACSPLRLHVDGAPSALMPNRKTPVVRLVHTRDRGLLDRAEGASFDLMAHDYTLFLDPERGCEKGGRWLYPGDQARWRVPASLIEEVGGVVRGLKLAGAPLGPWSKKGDTAPPSGQLTLTVSADGVEQMSHTLDLARWENPTLTLPEPVSGGELEVTLSLSPGSTYVLVSALELTP